MRGPLVGALFLALILITLHALQPASGGVSPVALTSAGTVTTGVATPMVAGKAKADERKSWFRDVQPAKSLAKLHTKATRTVVPHKVRTAVAPPPHAPTRPLTVSTTVAPRVTTYNSLNTAGIGATENTVSVSPPDSTGAIGPNYYVEIVNSRITVRSRADLTTVATMPLESFVGISGDILCDPQAQWDPSSNRWLMSTILCNASPGTGSEALFFGWSKTNDPSNLTTGWCNFGVSTGDEVFDYQKRGHNSKYMIFGGNFYDDSSLAFLSAAVGWATKPANGSTTCATTFNGTNTTLKNGDGFTLTFTPVPVNTNSAASDGYIVSAYDPAGNVGAVASQRKLAIWHLDSAGVLHAHPDIGVNLYSLPVAASQAPGLWGIDTL